MEVQTMARITLRRFLRASAVALIVVAGCVIDDASNSRTKEKRFADLAVEVKPLLRGIDWSSESQQPFRQWMSRHVIVGVTTQEQIIAIFGKDYHNLDRPARDDIVVLQFPPPSDATNCSWWLIFHFDEKRSVLLAWDLHLDLGVCGFCPHILVDDGRWRLEGKMLAGCVGSQRESVDTLVLPRLSARQGQFKVRLANWAREIEYLDQVELGIVPLGLGEELDVDVLSRPIIWKARRQIDVPRNEAGDAAPVVVPCDPGPAERVLVLEGRNTGTFETVMRKVFLENAPQPKEAALTLRWDNGTALELAPVGTKFLRRIIVAIPNDVREVTFDAANPLWFVRRAWLGSGRDATSMVWQAPIQASGANPRAAELLRGHDQQRLRLAPMEEVDLTFAISDLSAKMPAPGYVLRMRGYYDFIQPVAAGNN
jgi:hypothetical protein